MPVTLTPIPDRLYASIYALVLYSFEHVDRPEQAAAKAHLHEVLVSLNPLAVYDLAEALREHGRAFGRSCTGEWIVGENWVRERAYFLAAQVDVHIESEARTQVVRGASGRIAA